jgi:hypothetical protein
MEALPVDDQQHFDDLIRREEEEVQQIGGGGATTTQGMTQKGGRKVSIILHGGSPLEDHPSKGDRYDISPTFASGSYCKYYKSIS